MTVCKHCGTEIEDGLEYCPNCGQSIEENFGDFFNPDEELEEEAYNIFDAPEEFDMDSLLSREFERGSEVSRAELADIPSEAEEESLSLLQERESDDMEDLFALFEEKPIEKEEEPEEKTEEPAPEPEESLESPGEEQSLEISEAEEADFFALDDLFRDIESEPVEIMAEETEAVDQGLEELLAATAAGTEEKTEKKRKKEKKSFFQIVFGNVPIDPSKIKAEPTPEQIAEKKKREEEGKKAKAEAKKLAAEEKKQLAQRNKEEKARQKALAKEEKKAKKLEEAKLILEEMNDTRINRLGATIVFLFFAVCAIVLLSGSEIFGYAISIHNAENNFNKAYNNNVKYYTDAYNDIYGLEVKPEDQVLSDKIMTVMFVNKELNSYNSHMVLKDYEAALHSLLLGLYRYGKYYEKAVPLGIDRDMDFVRTQILKELKATFRVTEDEAEVLRSMLETAGVHGMDRSIDPDAAREYNLKLYEIVIESGLNNDSNN